MALNEALFLGGYVRGGRLTSHNDRRSKQRIFRGKLLVSGRLVILLTGFPKYMSRLDITKKYGLTETHDVRLKRR